MLNTETGGAVEPVQAHPGTLWSALTQFMVNLARSLSLSHPSQWEEILQLFSLGLLERDCSVDV